MAITISHTDGYYILNLPSKYDGELNIILARPPQNPKKLAGHYRRYWREFLKFRKECFKTHFQQSHQSIDMRNKKNRWIEHIFNEGMEKHFWRTWRTK